jgi:antitoxin component YwqK of YwqJK toxin-antitoxin module
MWIDNYLCKRLRLIVNNMSKKVYKSAGGFIIELILFQDSKTNEDRKNIIDKDNAKMRTNVAFVDRIYNKLNHTIKINSIRSDYDPNFIYKRKKTVMVENYDDSDEIYSAGIHFYYSYQCAFFNDLLKHEFNGIHYEWYDSGGIKEMGEWLNGQRNGIHEMWDENGKCRELSEWKMNILHGSRRFFDSVGRMEKIEKYFNGLKNGQEIRWYDNGVIKEETEWEIGKKNGLSNFFYNNETHKSSEKWTNDTLDGCCYYWFPSGMINRKEFWNMGKKKGESESWYPDGSFMEKSCWKNGVKNGYEIKWNHQGCEKEYILYVNGIISSHEECFPNKWIDNEHKSLEENFENLIFGLDNINLDVLCNIKNDDPYFDI